MIEKVQIGEITPLFEFAGYVQLGGGRSRQERLAFRGLDFPGFRSKKGKALYQHLMKVFGSVEFLAVRKYARDPLMRYPADFFYLQGEDDPVRVAQEGQCLNRELLELGLARPYDENKRKIDFSKRSIKVKNQEIELVTGNFKAEVCMYINDCKQYLRSAIEGKPVNMEKGEFDPTDEEFLIIYGLKEVKDMCMQAAGRRRKDWKGN